MLHLHHLISALGWARGGGGGVFHDGAPGACRQLAPTARGPALTYAGPVVPALRAMEARKLPPFGQSLFCVARPAAHADAHAGPGHAPEPVVVLP